MPAEPDQVVSTISGLSVAVVHDWLTGMRGGEKVLEAILDLVPNADLYTLFHFEGTVSEKISSHGITTSPLQSFARRAGNYRHLLPLYPLAVKSWDFSGYDLVISSSHAVAKGVATGSVPHLCYCHTPMRYVWDRFDDYFQPRRPVLRFAAEMLAPALRKWDRETSDSVDRFVANSSLVSERIKRFYDRTSTVVPPFVETRFLERSLSERRLDHHAVVSALVPYKRVDLAMRAADECKRKLEIVGDGPERAALERSATPGVEIRGRLPFDELARTVETARSLIIPGVEDFGITALEALALGTPVIASTDSGTKDVVIDGITGVLFDRARPGSLEEAILKSEAIEWDRARLRLHAKRFSRERFQRDFLREVENLVG